MAHVLELRREEIIPDLQTKLDSTARLSSIDSSPSGTHDPTAKLFIGHVTLQL